MSDTPQKPKPKTPPKTQAELRAARLQAALRDNLRRRKAAGTSPNAETADNHEKGTQNDSEK